VSSNNAGKKGIRIDGQEPWTPDVEDERPTVRIFMGEGRNVYIDSVRITEGSGVTGFSVQVMAIASEVSSLLVLSSTLASEVNIEVGLYINKCMDLYE
jgi:hypothetical protein